jgi:membrane protein implicated in regulation of membrane protease activity
MAWWMWILLGFGLLATETLTPGGFFVFFFGLSAVVVGCITGIGLAGSDQEQWLLFSAFSIASLLLLRPRIVDRFRTSTTVAPVSNVVGDIAVLVDDLEPGGIAKAELRGTSWNVRSHSSARLLRGSRCTVERVEGLTLWVAPPHDRVDDPA